MMFCFVIKYGLKQFFQIVTGICKHNKQFKLIYYIYFEANENIIMKFWILLFAIETFDLIHFLMRSHEFDSNTILGIKIYGIKFAKIFTKNSKTMNYLFMRKNGKKIFE